MIKVEGIIQLQQTENVISLLFCHHRRGTKTDGRSLLKKARKSDVQMEPATIRFDCESGEFLAMRRRIACHERLVLEKNTQTISMSKFHDRALLASFKRIFQPTFCHLA